MKAFTIKRSDIDRCPRKSLAVEHYRLDGSCHCTEATIKHEGDTPSAACPGCQNEGETYHEPPRAAVPPCPSKECAATGCDCMIEDHHSFDGGECERCGDTMDGVTEIIENGLCPWCREDDA